MDTKPLIPRHGDGFYQECPPEKLFRRYAKYKKLLTSTPHGSGDKEELIRMEDMLISHPEQVRDYLFNHLLGNAEKMEYASIFMRRLSKL